MSDASDNSGAASRPNASESNLKGVTATRLQQGNDATRPPPQQGAKRKAPAAPDTGSVKATKSSADATPASASRLGEEAAACRCQDGWLSPRTKFVLETVAAVAQDLIPGTDAGLVEEMGFVNQNCVYLTRFIASGYIPRGRKAAPLWVEGFTLMFEIMGEIFEAGRIPTPQEMERTLGLPAHKKDQKLFKAYAKKGADCEGALGALVQGAKDEWTTNGADFRDAHCVDNPEWKALPRCKEHDFDWSMAEDVMTDA
ncbi:hypothetical protein B0H11DRAFT_1297832 [Mycena galericulata]|nr:hypothetical protein B0H11DRAFT_1297832 [Mycena galericulata]